MSHDPRQGARGGIWPLVAHYPLWLITVALAILDIVFVRKLLLALYVALQLGKWAYGLADKAGLIVLGLACVVGVFLAEEVYRRSALVGWSLLMKRFLTITAIQAAFIVAGLLAR